jgi:hypothetical protein
LKSNFRFIEKNIDVSKILNQVLSNSQDWKAVSAYKNISGDLEPYGFLPLVMAWVKEEGVSPKDTEYQMNTPMYKKYTEIRKWLKIQGITEISRAAFFKLRIDGSVGRHVDEGAYYSTRDRFHLSLQGKYLYHVDGEEHVIEPGTWFWFNNKKHHWAKNISPDTERITFVWDVPHHVKHPNNSRNFI